MFNKPYALFFFLPLFLLALPGCWQSAEKGEEKQTLYVINVLDKKLYDECHIAGSISVPFTNVMNWAKNIDKGAEIAVYCANYACTASAFAAQQLIDDGFKYVWAYEAGMHDWFAHDLPSICSVKSGYLAKENKPLEEETNVPVLSTEELHKKMIKHGILNSK